MKGRKEQHGIPMHTHGLKDSHLNRFLKDEAQPLSSYGVFHGDDRQQLGEPLPTGSLRRPSAGSLGATHSNHTAFSGSYVIRPTMSLHTLQKNSPYLSKTMSASKTLSASSYAPSQQGTAYLYQSGTTFRSTSGVPPTQYKSWTSEYADEHRDPKVRKEILHELTQRHDTTYALKNTRYQFQGYPNHTTNPAFKQLSPSSLSERGQIMPNYTTRLQAF